MKNYIINNNTIALVKNYKKIYIINVDNILVFNKSIYKILDYNCNYYGSSYLGRKNSAKKILKIKYKVPIVVDEYNNITLIQLSSPRNNFCLYLVTNKIINYEMIDNKLKIICINDIIFKIKISEKKFEKLLIKSIQLNNILKWRKNVKFL